MIAEFSLPFMGDESLGHVSALQYSAALETPMNEAFVKKYRAKYGKEPPPLWKAFRWGPARGDEEDGLDVHPPSPRSQPPARPNQQALNTRTPPPQHPATARRPRHHPRKPAPASRKQPDRHGPHTTRQHPAHVTECQTQT